MTIVTIGGVATPDTIGESDPVGGEDRGKRSRWAALAAVVVGTTLIAAMGAIYGRWIVDDAAITFDYARNIALGYGPVAQPSGAVVEGYSNPTWLVLLIAGRMLGLFDHGLVFGVPDYILYPKALAVLCCAGIVLAIYLVASDLYRRPWLVTVLAAAVLSGTSSFVIWSFSGLENPLYALLITWLAAILVRATARRTLLHPRIAMLTGGLVFVAALTRPDGLIYVAAYPLLVLLLFTRARMSGSLRGVALSFVAFTLPYGAFLTFRYSVFGHLVPNTAIAKTQSLPDLTDLSRVGELFSYAGWLLVVVLAVCVGVTSFAGGRPRRALAAPLVVLLLGLLAYAVLTPDWMPYYRFSTPVWPLAVLTGVVALPGAYAAWDRRANLVVGVLLACGLVFAGQYQYAVARTFRAAPTVPACSVADVTGRGFNGLASILGMTDASLLTPDLGGSSLTSRLQLVDLAGLVDPTIADFWSRGDLSGLRNYVLGQVRPTFMAISVDWANSTGLLTDARVQRDYEPLANAGFGPGNFVRRDAVSSATQLAQLRSYQRDVISPRSALSVAAPRRGCGSLAVGQQLR